MANMVYNPPYPLQSWILGTATNHHVIPDIAALQQSESYNGGDHLQIGNGKGMKILNTVSTIMYFCYYEITHKTTLLK